MIQYRVVGQRLPRLDALDKATGTATYTGDLRLPGMLYGRLVRSSHPHALVTRLDGSRALAGPDVAAVIGPEDAPGKAFNSAALSFVTPPRFKVTRDQRVFAERARYLGDVVAAVAASTPESAEAALDLIDVEYFPLPAVFDPEEAMLPGAPLAHDGAESNVLSHVKMAAGDLDRGFDEADLVLEETYTTSRQKQCQMETNVSVASFGGDGRLTLWTTCALPHLCRLMVADIFDLPPDRVRVVTLSIGGGFGNRLGLVAEPYAVALAAKTERPVMVEIPREEDFYGTESRHPSLIRLKAGARKDGILTAIQATAIVNTGAYATHGHGVRAVIGGTMRRLYPCPNFQYDGYAVYTNTPVAGAYRGYGGPQALFALESHMDSLARGLGLDPLEFRLRNAVQPGADDPATGWPISSHSLEECLRRGAQASGWPASPDRTSERAVARGAGAACFVWSSGSGGNPRMPERSEATVDLDDQGRVRLFTGACDPGTGATTALAQIAAEELGQDPEDLVLTVGDTDATPFDVGSHASRTVYVAGGAVLAAAGALRQKIVEQASELLEASPADLALAPGRVYVKGSPSRWVSMDRVAAASREAGRTLGARVRHEPANAPPFGAQFVQAEVDLETGQVCVSKVVAAHDVGRAINPAAVEGQIEGALQHGLGYALTEGLWTDGATGQTLNPSFLDYRMATALDMPSIETILVEAPDATGPYGAKGVGESAMLATAAAVANAIIDATGVRVRDLPMTGESILDGLDRRHGSLKPS
ncbi:MAG: molybdopterin-dependent oxidoreductase [Dehalococcoidia bacterium]|nr:molybdopterin-dependent oxidoreductase [Dehalococcoidia bacterium]